MQRHRLEPHDDEDVEMDCLRGGQAVNDAVARTVGIVGLGGIALIHALQAPEAFEETTYLGVLFNGRDPRQPGALDSADPHQRPAGLGRRGRLAAAIMLGYVLTRTSGLPDATLDVGNWTEPLGLASLAPRA
jgi:hypothetical protein